MKKIGILTIHNSPNYGACLQCYALWKYINDLGHHCEVINLYRPLAFEDYKDSKKFHLLRNKKLGLLQKIKKFVLSYRKNESLFNEEARKKFDKFNGRITFSKPYRGLDELYDTPPIYDIYIAGSDQLWNPSQTYCVEPYFLTFVDSNNAIKISYATSLGVSELNNNEELLYKKWLEDFTEVSVREESARKLLSRFVNKDIYQVADPTFLISEEKWKDIIKLPNLSDYILLFSLNHNEDLLKYTISLGKQSNKKVVYLTQIQPQNTTTDYVSVVDAGPEEWLGYIKSASMVITNSFHATVFSIILRTNNFYTYIPLSSNRGSRIIDLLSTYHLSSHLLNSSLTQSFDELSANEISNREQISHIISLEKEKSVDFLNRFLIN